MATFKAAAAGESEQQWRQYLAYLHDQTSVGLATTGVMAGLVVAQTTTASASVTVSSGAGVVQDAALSGASPLVSTTSVTLDVLGASPMGATPRNDIVVFDLTTVSLLVIAGAPAAVPSDPSYSSTQIPLARLRHAASATTVPAAKIDDIRTFVGPPGASRQPLAVATGSVTISGTGVAAGSGVSVTATFPVGRFTVPPIVTASMTSAPGGSQNLVARAINATTSSVTVYLYNTGATAATWTPLAVGWTAVQMTPTSAAG